MSNGNVSVVIAGGGIGGLALGRGLVRRGFDVQVLERAEHPVPERGTGLTLWGNAMAVLAEFGCADEVAESGGRVWRNHILSSSGKVLIDSPVGEISERLGVPGSYVVRRTNLLAALYDEGRSAPVRTGVEVVGYRDEGAAVHVDLADGDTVTGDILICADGARSVLREKLVGDGEATPVGFPIWRGISNGDPGLEPGIGLLVWGPAGGGIGGGNVGGDGVSWTISTNSALERRRAAGEFADDKSALRAFTSGMHANLEKALAWTDPEDIISAQIRVRSLPEPWGRGRVSLLGDSAHALPTAFGQGACQALEDAKILADELSTQDDPVAALRTYESRRHTRMAELRKKIMMIDKFARIENRTICSLRDAAVARLPFGKSPQTWEQILQPTT